MIEDRIYNERIAHYQKKIHAYKNKSNGIGYIRLLISIGVLSGIYLYYSTHSIFSIILLGCSTVAFFLLIRIHRKVKKELAIELALKQINEEELAYLQGSVKVFANGSEYIDKQHPYSYDLDLFGEHSLFQHTNRTATKIGQDQLASMFNKPVNDDILINQEAIQELSNEIDWRQKYTALGKINPDQQNSVDQLSNWISQDSFFNRSKKYLHLAYILPGIWLICAGLYLFNDNPTIEYAVSISFLINLIFFGTLLKHIKKEYELLNNSSKILATYSDLIECIEKQEFKSNKIKILQNNLKTGSEPASTSLKKLSSILFKLDSMHYGLPSIIVNGTLLFHIHCIYSLNNWKRKHGSQLQLWLKSISEIDALNSLANFSFNRPDFIFPLLSKKDQFVTTGLGHPLISEEHRICNSISFSEQRFTVLTGSNMSGKSTFLRTMGMNLILSKMGAPVCAKEFKFYPYEVFISMRIDDSLHNNTSFFFAELHRLKNLIDRLSIQPKTFILLDEILRGTNSNDKYAGTIGLIKQLIQKNAIGIIATHDLSVTELSAAYPSYLNNKCFEVEIKNEELYFDYKLKDGVCEKMSASFLMKKLHIID